LKRDIVDAYIQSIERTSECPYIIPYRILPGFTLWLEDRRKVLDNLILSKVYSNKRSYKSPVCYKKEVYNKLDSRLEVSGRLDSTNNSLRRKTKIIKLKDERGFADVIIRNKTSISVVVCRISQPNNIRTVRALPVAALEFLSNSFL